jgi:hypothetical protein
VSLDAHRSDENCVHRLDASSALRAFKTVSKARDGGGRLARMDVTEEPATTVTVCPVLVAAPVWWVAEFWSTHAWDWVAPGLPLDEKPAVTLEVGLSVTLGEIVDATSTALDLRPLKVGDYPVRTLSREIAGVRFVQPGDEDGIRDENIYGWPARFPIATPAGDIHQIPWQEVTMRELLVARELGLVQGDVTRPYIQPNRAQGDPGAVLELVRLALHVIRQAYDLWPYASDAIEHSVRVVRGPIDAVNRATDEAGRVVFWWQVWRWIRQRSKRDDDDD